jgi:hypothetical protein
MGQTHPAAEEANPGSSAAQFKNGGRLDCLISGATFREKETKQFLQAGGVRRVPQEFLIAPHLNQPLVPKLVEVMRERRRSDIELHLNIAHDHTLRMGGNQQMHNAQARLRAHRREHIRESGEINRDAFSRRLPLDRLRFFEARLA